MTPVGNPADKNNSGHIPMQRSFGFWRSWALVVGSMIGNGIFLLPAVLAPYGSLSVLGWLFSGIGTLLIAFMLGTLAKRNPKLGGPYAYTHMAFGDLPSFFVGWGHWVSYCSATAVGGIAFVAYLGFFIPQLVETPAMGAIIALAVIWIVTALNISGTKSAGIFQLITTVLKLLPLFLIAGGGVLLGDVGGIPASNPHNESPVILMSGLVILTMWAFVGVENVTIAADEVIEPEKTIPRALLVGTLTAVAFYITATLGVMALVPQAELAQSSSPFADAAVVLFGNWGGALVAGGAIVSIVGALNGNVLTSGMLPRAIALDKLFPMRFANLNKAGSPVFSLVVAAAIASLLIVMNYTKGLLAAFEMLIILSTLTTLLPYAASALSEFVLQKRDAAQGKGVSYKTLIIALGALLFSLFAIVGSGLDVAAYGLVLLAAGYPIYRLQKRKAVS